MACEPDSADVLPVFDLTSVVDKSLDEADPELCASIARCLHETGCLIVRDPRVPADHNDRFLDLLEAYFGQPVDRKMEDCRPGLDYQVGVTPCGTEVPRCLVDTQMQDQLRRLKGGNRATMPTGADLKWRYMWRVGQRPQSTNFPELNAEPVVPGAFPEWSSVMDGWGAALLGAATSVAGLLARGLGLGGTELQELMSQGPHLLAPTGSDLDCNGRLGAVLAGFHYDLNLLTVHGRSRFPGLYVWLRDGRRVAVRIPAGCLLMQAGKQLEWLTGGHIRAGMHEVVVTEATLAAVEAARAAGRSTWRISSTVFTHCASDATLRPLGRFAHLQEQQQQQQSQQRQEEAGDGGDAGDGAEVAYPPIRAGDQVQQELEAICLRKAAAASAAAGTAGSAPAPCPCPSPAASSKGDGAAFPAAVAAAAPPVAALGVGGGGANTVPAGGGGACGSANNGSSCATGVAVASR
ncbi:hypothetical protein PLESTB_000212400 [Pleodorina starrii]|uniref:Non-haem dioxygenase N-terminal domain-containing protein n=1 Tax=Pleodorina starrii TaxID=330485 RepID=A0A9W6BD01_9CHLO|nr:hypothetical protein PLESTM_001538200 [Pleodorina starrii]GLC49372.1 hypothetical protein PLESTB_000212400 [Pleodorina starrii]GLC73365.1 hypothetical protein PLESTF_001367500 [Pleodorina starrii]